jgi:hypothetical protein
VWGKVPDDPVVQPDVEPGPPGWVLVNLACRPGDVLVVGAGRRGTLARMAFSKVGRYCLAHARCPVLAIPPPALARELAHGRLALDVLAPATDSRADPSRPAQASAIALSVRRAESALGAPITA